MRLPLAQPFKTRTGVPDKDSRMKNCYVEGKGDPTQPTYQTTVRKRPVAQGGVAVGTGTAQGGIGFYIGSTPYFIGVWGDTLINYVGNGTSWSSGTNYLTGSMISYNFVNYWSDDDNNIDQDPSDPAKQSTPSNRSKWSKSYVPSIPRFSTISPPSGYTITNTLTVIPNGQVSSWTVTQGATLISSGSGEFLFAGGTKSFSAYVLNRTDALWQVSILTSEGSSVTPPPSGYNWYILSGSATFNGTIYAGSYSFIPF